MASIAELLQESADSTRHIVEAHARIARQRELIGQLSADRHHVAHAQDLLRTMVESLETMQVRRQQIVGDFELARRCADRT
jgi:hypothetical protein